MPKRARPSPSASDDEDPLPSPSPSHRQKKSKLRRSHFEVKEASLPVNKPPTRVTRTPSLQESSQEVQKSGSSKKTHKSTKKPPTDVSGSPSPKLNLTVCQKTVLGKLGRAVIRSVGFHLDLDKIFRVGITRDRSKSKSRMTDEETVMYTLYCKILALSPLLTFFVKNEKSSLLEISLRKVMDASSGARSADSNKLKEAVPRYAPSGDFKTNPLVPAIDPGIKSDRGLNHMQLGRLICPVKYLRQFDNNPTKTLENLRSGRLELSSKEDKLPTFLFEGYLWDKNDALSGFGLGEYFLRCYRHIFTSPSSAIKGENKSSRACNSKITGISEATPEGVAYVAVQAHFAATSWSSWNKILKYGKFSYVEFYDTVVQLFSVDPDGEWQQATLKAITNEVFEKIDDSGSESDDSSPGFSALIAARNKQARDRPSKLSSSSSEPEDLPRTSSPEGSQSSIVSAPEPPPRARPANATVSKNKPGRDDTDADEHREESPSAGRTHFPTPAAADGDARSTSSSPAPCSLPRRKPKQSMPLDDDEAEDIEAEGSLLVTSPPNAPSLTKPASTSEKVQRLGASKKKHGTGLPVEPTWLSPWSSDEEGNASKDGPDTGDLSPIVNKSLDTTDHPKLPAQKKRKVKHLAQPAASGSRSTRLTRANAGAPG